MTSSLCQYCRQYRSEEDGQNGEGEYKTEDLMEEYHSWREECGESIHETSFHYYAVFLILGNLESAYPSGRAV